MPWCVEATAATDEGKIRGGSCSGETRPIRFALDFTNALVGTCVYQRSTPAIGSIATDVNGQAATASASEQEWTKLEGNIGCPATGKFDVSLRLETGTGSPTYFSS
jgi:hypothetical protein